MEEKHLMLMKLLILAVMPLEQSSLRIMLVDQEDTTTCGALALGLRTFILLQKKLKVTKLLYTFCSVIYKNKRGLLCKVDSRAYTTSAGSASMVFLRLRTKWALLCLFQWCEITSGPQVAVTPL